MDTGADPRGGNKDEQTAVAGTIADAYKQWVASSPDAIQEGKGGPERWVTTGGSRTINEETGVVEMSGGTGKWVPLSPQERGWQLWNQAKQEAEDLKLGDYLGGNGAGAGQSYVSAEEDKQDEVTRQFKDFLARAKGTYDLMDSEQDFASNTDQMNIRNERAVQDGYMPPGALPSYGHRRGPGLSSIIAPSLPNYLSPDYRMNQAVGLGGPEGFNDPEYDEYGMPLYAMGTDPMADPALAGIPPELLGMVGQTLYVPMSKRTEPPKAWPWGYVAQ